jgi:hypothetical protein
MLPAIFLFAAALHVLSVTAWRLSKGETGFCGKFADSFNATCAFASFFVAFLPLLYLLLEAFKATGATKGMSELIVVPSLLALLLVLLWAASYLPRALAAVHSSYSINPGAYAVIVLFVLAAML